MRSVNHGSDYKLAIIIRQDLKMGKGKIAVQAGHASVIASEAARKKHRSWWRRWIDGGQCKVVLKVDSELELFKLRGEAEKLDLPTVVIHDKGLTQVKPGTVTCLGIGPGPSKLIDEVTGCLRLL
ncbi:MAG: peptidyl-tRNA hydrolase Pth2 [Candidatus Bathyarchaeia archaeon]